MPSKPAAPVYDEEELQRRPAPPEEEPAAPPANKPVAPRTGVTGGEVPEFQSDRDARQPITWSEDPIERRSQIEGEITRRRQAQNAAAHPFQPTAWSQDHRAPGSIRADQDFTRQAEEQAAYQRSQVRAGAIAKRATDNEALKTENDALEAKYRGNGQQFYTDAHGRIKPVVDTETGRELYHQTGWEPGKNPKTGEASLTMRDKYGQRQFKIAPVVPSLDPTDDQMYYKMPDGETVAAGSIDDLAKHPNYNIAKTALAAKTRQLKAINQQALEPLKAIADQSSAQLEEARSQIQSLDQQITKVQEQAANTAGTPLGEGYSASLGQLQAQRDALDAKTKPRGELGLRVARSRAGYAIASAQAMHDTFAAQQEEIAARVRAQGGNPEKDPTYIANQRGMMQAQQLVSAAHGQFDQVDSNLSPTSAPSGAQFETQLDPQGEQQFQQWKQQYAPNDSGADYDLRGAFKAGVTPGADGHWPDTFKKPNHPTFSNESIYAGAAPDRAGSWNGNNFVPPGGNDVLQQSEPVQALARGVKNVGGVSMQEFAKRYGSGQGPVVPASVIKLYQRSKEIEDTLANEDSTINETLRGQMAKEKDYVDALAKQRFARLDPSAQSKITEATRDPTWWETAKGVALGVARGAGKALVDVGESAARNADQIPNLAIPGITKVADALTPQSVLDERAAGKEKIGEVADAMRQSADEYKASSSPQVEQKLREGTLTGTIPEAVGGVLLFAAGGELVGAAGKAIGLGDAAISGLTKAATVAAGAGQSGNSLRREAITQLAPELKAGRITQDEYNKSVGMAELAGSTIGGVAMGLGPISKFATRLNDIPAGKTFLAGLLDRAAKGGSNSAMKWLAGEGGSKALSDVVREGAEMSGVTFAQDLATDLAAKKTFDPNRKIDPNKAGESAAQMGFVGALLSALTHVAPKPKSGGEAAKPEAPKPPTPEQQAAEAEFQKKLAEPPPKPSTAEEAAKVFEPALKERENTPPPAKSAKESADVIQSETKRLADSESEAQKLADELSSVSGRPREEIIAERQGKEGDVWRDELKKEIEYQKNPLGTDPERRSTELKADLKRLDQEWARHVNQVSADAELAASKDAIKEKVEQQMSDARTRHERLTERRSAIETELTKAEQLRQSGKGAEDLKGELTAEQKQAEVDTRKLATPELEARRDAIETGLNEAERFRQSNKGAADLKTDLAKQAKGKPTEGAEFLYSQGGHDYYQIPDKESSRGSRTVDRKTLESEGYDTTNLPTVADKVTNLDADGFDKWAKDQAGNGGYTEVAHKAGIAAIGDAEAINKLKAGRERAQKEASEALKSGNEDQAMTLLTKGSFFREAVEAAENTGSAAEASIVKSAHAKKGAQENVTQQSKETVLESAPRGGNDEGRAVGKSEDAKSGNEGRAGKADESPSPVPKAVTAPIDSGNPKKDAAPASAHITEAPEEIAGKKISKEWTAFSKESGGLNIPRSEMPQIKSEHRGALVNFLRARDIPTKAVMVHPDQLKPTQAEFSPEKVQKAREHTGSERPILISSDGHVVDGHHQWVASLDDPSTPMPALRLNAPIDRVLAEMKEFPSTQTAEGAKPTKPTAAAGPATQRLSDRAIEALQKAKIDTKGKVFDATQAVYVAAHNSAIDLAILGVRAGRAVADVVKLAIDRFKARHKDASQEQLAQLEADIRKAVESRPPEPEPGTAESRVPKSLKEVGVPAKNIEYDVRAQNERMAEARAAISKEGQEKAEAMIADRQLPADTRVAIGGVLLEKKMEALKSATPDEAAKITRDIQRITDATRSSVSTEAGQGVAMHNKIYQNLAVGSAMEYAKSATKARAEKMGGKELESAAQEAADAFNKITDKAERDAAIEKLKKKYTTKPVREALDAMKRAEVAGELNGLGLLTRDDMVNIAGNALGIPGIEQAKLKHIAELADKVTQAKSHAERSRAQLELADTLGIYKGVSPLDLETSILTLNILSGPSTQLANLEGNALNLVAQLGTTAAVNPTKIGPIMKGVMDGIPLGWDQAKSIMATGRGTKDFQDRTSTGNALANVDYARDFPKLNKTAGDALTVRARAVDKISRFMKAADAVFYYPAREAYARLVTTKLLEGEYKGQELAQKVSETLHVTPKAFLEARQQGISEGYTGVDLGRRVADIIEASRAGTDTGKRAVEESERFAAEATYNNEPTGIAGVIYRNLARTVKDTDVNGVPVLKPWAMFLRVPANVFNTATNFTPLGATRATFGVKGESYRKNGTGEGQWRNFSKDERNRLYLQSVIGTTLMGAMTARVLSGKNVNITATGPDDSKKRDQLKQDGWNPYSIKVGDKWVSYKDSPLMIPLAMVGHVADDIRYQKSSAGTSLEAKVGKASAQSLRVIFDTSMLSGMANLMSTLSGHGSADNLSRSLGSIPANLIIPYNRLLQQIDQTFDAKTYKSNSAKEAVPFLRRTGTPESDVQGRPKEYDPFTRFVSTQKNDPVGSILSAKNVFIPEPGKDTKVGNRVMTEPEFDKYRQLSGQRIRVRLQTMIPQLRSMTQEQAQKRIEQISREERDKVRPLVAGVR